MPRVLNRMMPATASVAKMAADFSVRLFLFAIGIATGRVAGDRRRCSARDAVRVILSARAGNRLAAGFCNAGLLALYPVFFT